jgi:hypothetical protein
MAGITDWTMTVIGTGTGIGIGIGIGIGTGDQEVEVVAEVEEMSTLTYRAIGPKVAAELENGLVRTEGDVTAGTTGGTTGTGELEVAAGLLEMIKGRRGVIIAEHEQYSIPTVCNGHRSVVSRSHLFPRALLVETAKVWLALRTTTAVETCGNGCAAVLTAVLVD